MRSVARAGLRSCRDTASLCRARSAIGCTHTSTVRTQAVLCVLPGDLVTTRTPGRDKEPEFFVAIENRSVASRSRAGSGRARRPPLAVATKNFLSRPTTENLCHDRDFSITTESQNSLSR